jgi:hypothetical protein
MSMSTISVERSGVSSVDRKPRRFQGMVGHRLTPEQIQKVLRRPGTYSDGLSLVLMVRTDRVWWTVRFGGARTGCQLSLAPFAKMSIDQARALAAKMRQAWLGYRDLVKTRSRLLARGGFRQIRRRCTMEQHSHAS